METTTNYPEMLIRRSVVPMFRAPDPLSEQVSQALLGMRVHETGGRDEWRLIQTPDGYDGWVAAAALIQPPAGWSGPWSEVTDLWANLRADADYRLAAVTQAVIGTQLPVLDHSQPGEPARVGFEDWERLLLPDGRCVWTEAKRVRRVTPVPPCPATPAQVCRTARRFLGVPYLWGGCSPLGLDCSGFVQLVMRLHGIPLLRDAGPQMTQGEPAPQPEAADLVFFGPGARPEQITHVGLLLDRERFVHAAGSDCVRVNRLGDEAYREMYRGARRLVAR